jgi:hypothetical protein
VNSDEDNPNVLCHRYQYLRINILRSAFARDWTVRFTTHKI